MYLPALAHGTGRRGLVVAALATGLGREGGAAGDGDDVVLAQLGAPRGRRGPLTARQAIACTSRMTPFIGSVGTGEISIDPMFEAGTSVSLPSSSTPT